ncbi:conserved hypothetical protein (DUF1697) [Alteracholeplasma palmae J233]|uniref:DUF1697 domain-containing protein n=1 Tax=Alteracholeplasma palmae (strain ATCC 49389 / J233) TaxID=1318466 RepID=U4KLK7_ALTPJ|nr:conserved hypothetical protein (DUF1697) [Alteracholeplasma palmae J233]
MLLRGINVGGKNIISMKELKTLFEDSGFKNVKTYINSGNVIFSSEQTDINQIISHCESLIKEQFSLDIKVLIVEINKFIKVIEQIPSTFKESDKDYYDTVVFMMPGVTAESVLNTIENKLTDYDVIHAKTDVIYWRAYLPSFSKSGLGKLAATKVNQLITIRTIKTVNKILELHYK